MSDLTFTQEIVKVLVQGMTPVVFLVAGGKYLLNRYEISKKRREQEVELAAFIRERQYEALQELYSLFAKFMQLYRHINSPSTKLSLPETKSELFKEAVEAESLIDAAILRIGSEFTHDNQKELESLLGNLRQSVQLWRESIQNEESLPFTYSEQKDYLRFKESFAKTTAYLANKIYDSLSPAEVKMEQANNLLYGAFSNKYEW